MSSKTALGIHISEKTISMALLSGGEKGPTLIKSANAPLANSIMKDGRIVDSIAMSKAIRELKTQNKMQARQTAISLFAKPMLVQVLDVPKEVPKNMKRFVRNELKNYVALAGREIVFDYCGVGGGGKLGGNKILVAAGDAEAVSEIARVCNRASLNVKAIEPSLLAYIRTFYRKIVGSGFKSIVLMAVVQQSSLILCVFRNKIIDFIRVKDINTDDIEDEELGRLITDQIHAVVQFYNTEIVGGSEEWDINIIADLENLPADITESVKEKIACNHLHLGTRADMYQDTPFSDYKGSDHPSPVAVGLAMKLLKADENYLKLNLIPPESAEVKALKKDVLITANFLAVILFLMILVTGGLTLAALKINRNIERIKGTRSMRDAHKMLKQQEEIDKLLTKLASRPEKFNVILKKRPDLNLRDLLDNIRNATPKTVRITGLYMKGGSKMTIEGVALSYEVVHLFVEMLNQSAQIDSASLVETEKDSDDGGLVRYQINCLIKVPQKEPKDAA